MDILNMGLMLGLYQRVTQVRIIAATKDLNSLTHTYLYTHIRFPVDIGPTFVPQAEFG